MADEKIKETISKSCRFCVPAYANLQEGIETYPEDILQVQKNVLGAKMRFCVYIDGSPNSQQLYITESKHGKRSSKKPMPILCRSSCLQWQTCAELHGRVPTM